MTIDAVVEEPVERVADSGNLLENLKLIKPNSWQTAAEVFKAWNGDLHYEGVSTANLAVYRLENNEAVFELLGREGNPFMDEALREEAYNGIREDGYIRNWKNESFLLPQGKIKEKIKAAKKVTIYYSGLNIKTKGCGCDNSNYGYVLSDGNNTDEEKKLFSAVYGTDNPGNGKHVYLLRKDVVEAQLQNKPNELIARMCNLYINHDFSAISRSIYTCFGAVRGVRLKKVA